MMNALRLFSLFCFALCCAASEQPADLGVAADTAYQNKSWSEAERLYLQLTQSHPAVGRYWYRLGVSQHNAGHNEQALSTFESAKSKGFPSFFVDYGMAEVYASLGRRDNALGALREAVKKGFSQPDQLTSDPDFESLRTD